MTTPLADLRARHVEAAMQRLGHHLEALTWDRATIERHQTSTLETLVRHARTHAPWHRDRIPDVRNPADLLRAIPPMTKADLMANWDGIVTDERVTLANAERYLDQLGTEEQYYLDEFHVCASGGSSGTRGVYLWGWDAWAEAFLGFVRHLVRKAIQDAEDGAVSGQDRVVVLSAMSAGHMGELSRTFADMAPVQNMHVDVRLPIEDIFGKLEAFDPTVISGYSSTIGRLAHATLEGRLDINPRYATGMAEPVLPKIRQVVREAWGIEMRSIWGASEIGLVSHETIPGSGQELLNEDQVIIEPVDKNGVPVPVGQRADKIYVTSLINPVMPLFRFEISDEITMLETPDPMGSGHRLIENVLGRNDDSFEYANGALVHAEVLRTPLGLDRRISEYQVEQTPNGVDVRIVATSTFDSSDLSIDVAHSLMDAGLPRPMVTLSFVDRLSLTHIGKLRRFIPLERELSIV